MKNSYTIFRSKAIEGKVRGGVGWGELRENSRNINYNSHSKEKGDLGKLQQA